MGDTEVWVGRAVVGAIVAAVGGLFLRVRTNESRLAVAEKTLARYEDTEREVRELKTLAARIDERLNHLPTQRDLQLIHDRISKNGDATHETALAVAGLNEAVTGVRSAVDRLHAAELKKGEG